MQDERLRTEWVSSQKNNVLRFIERLCTETAVEFRRVQRRLQKVEETMANQQEVSLPSGTLSAAVSGGQCALSEVELLNRKLAAAYAEIRRYETRLFAYERAMLALRRENAELQALCDKAQKGEKLPEPVPQEPVLDKPELPVIHFPAPARDAGSVESSPSAEIEELLETGTPEWEPKTKLDYLSMELLSQMKRLMEP